MYTLRKAETLHFQVSLTSKPAWSLLPLLLATVWANRIFTSLTSEQRHCTIQFILYINSAPPQKLQNEQSFGERSLGEDNTCIAEVQRWFDKLRGSEELDLQPA